MKNLTPIQKLDKTLELLRSGSIGYPNLMNALEVGPDELLRILRKLEKDDYVKILPVNQVFITYDGHLFHGYQRQQEIDELQNKINENVLSARLKNDRRLVLWTAFAGISAMLLLLWTIFLFFYSIIFSGK